MKEKKFDENVETIYNTLPAEQKAEYIHKEDRMNKGFIVTGIVLLLLVLALVISGIVLYIQGKGYELLLVSSIFAIFGILIAQWVFRSSIRELKATDDIKVKQHIKRLESQKQYKQQEAEKQLQKNVYYRLSVENIKTVTILDSYTEVSDKLHAFLNYQEIIQTRVYKFSVDYKDGNSRIITAAENSEEYNVLMPLVNKSADTQTPTIQEKSNIEKLREYKQLLDDGIITQEEFDAKKKELL